jgi:LysM repeat protein
MKRLISLLLLLVGLTALLGSCGGGGGEEATPTPTVTAHAATATPVATPQPTPTPTPTPSTYEVQPGDTLLGIAGQFGIDVEALAAANDISDADVIYPGQVLDIPAPEP